MLESAFFLYSSRHCNFIPVSFICCVSQLSTTVTKYFETFNVKVLRAAMGVYGRWQLVFNLKKILFWLTILEIRMHRQLSALHESELLDKIAWIYSQKRLPSSIWSARREGDCLGSYCSFEEYISTSLLLSTSQLPTKSFKCSHNTTIWGSGF